MGCGGGSGAPSSPTTPTPTPTPQPSESACTDVSNADALGGVSFITFLDPVAHGCRLVNGANGHPTFDGSQSARFEVRATDCNSSPAIPDCQTDRSRYEIQHNNRGTTTDGRVITYEMWVYVPPQARFRPKGTNIMFLNQINFLRLNDEGGTRGIDNGTLAYLEVGESGELMIRTHSDFNDTIQARHVVLGDPVGVWTKIVWEIKGSAQSDGYLRVHVNDVLRVDETKRTLPSPGQRHSLRVGIYNAFKSGAIEPYDTQVTYFDGIKTSIR